MVIDAVAERRWTALLLHDLKTTCRGVSLLVESRPGMPLGLKIPDSFKVNSFKLARTPRPPFGRRTPGLTQERDLGLGSTRNGGVEPCVPDCAYALVRLCL